MDINSLLSQAAQAPSTSKTKNKIPDVMLEELEEPIVSDQAQKLRSEAQSLIKQGAISPALFEALDIDGEYEGGVIEQWSEAHRAMKDAKSRMVMAESRILPLAERARITESQREGQFFSSIKIGGKIVVSTNKKYSKIDPQYRDILKREFGGEFDQFFKFQNEVSLKSAAINDPHFVKKLVETFGQQVFAQYFEVKQSIQPTEIFHTQRSMNEDLIEKFNKFVDMGIIRPTKPSVKQA